MNKILINCSNLHTGGGVAVATSFIDSLSRLDLSSYHISVLASSPVHNNLMQLGVNFSVFESYSVKDYRGLLGILKGIDAYIYNFDLVFTVFGPLYSFLKPKRHIVGFAQPNIIYPNNHSIQSMPLMQRISSRFKYALQVQFFSRCDELIVELEHVRIGLMKIPPLQNKKIHVVYSAVHSIFQNRGMWSKVNIEPSCRVKLGVISKNYRHKNLRILPLIKRYLKSNHNIDADFYVTFTTDEYESMGDDFTNNIINVGGLSLNQCPSFYEKMDGVIFPTLLECFSAVPIEAMMMKRRLFASNLPFIKDVCGNHCSYFDPFSAEDAANSISSYLSLSTIDRDALIDAAYNHVALFPDAMDRAKSYVKILAQ